MRAKLSMIASVMVPAWGRCVVVLVGVLVALGSAGLSEESGYALIPGVFMALSPPVGRARSRVVGVTVTTAALAALVWLGAQLSREPWAVVVGLVVVAFACGVLPRVGPRAAAMQTPLLVGFAYSAAFSLTEGSAADRVGAILVAWPVYVVGVALVFQPELRKPLRLGAAAAFGAIADTLDGHLAGTPEAGRLAEVGGIRFRVASARLNDAALPLDRSADSQAARLLTVSVQEAITAVQWLAGSGSRADRVSVLAAEARALASALVGAAPLPAPEAAAAVAVEARADGDEPSALLAEALAASASALAVLHEVSARVPSGVLSELPSPLTRLRAALSPSDPIFRRAARLAVAAGLAGLVAESLDLTRTYWAVFAAVVVLNAPPAQDRTRALMRIGGTVAGFVAAVGLLALVGDHSGVAFVLALAILLPGLLLMPVNYAAAVGFITCTVSMFYSASGEESDFLEFRVLDNAVGVAVVLLVGLLMWRVSRDDWWQSARLTCESLAAAMRSADPAAHSDELAVRALQLRGETVDISAMPDAGPAFVPAWSFVAAAEDLMRAVAGPRTRPGDRIPVATRVDELAARCQPSSEHGDAWPRPTSREEVDVARMAAAVARLQVDTEAS